MRLFLFFGFSTSDVGSSILDARRLSRTAREKGKRSRPRTSAQENRHGYFVGRNHARRNGGVHRVRGTYATRGDDNDRWLSSSFLQRGETCQTDIGNIPQRLGTLYPEDLGAAQCEAIRTRSAVAEGKERPDAVYRYLNARPNSVILASTIGELCWMSTSYFRLLKSSCKLTDYVVRHVILIDSSQDLRRHFLCFNERRSMLKKRGNPADAPQIQLLKTIMNASYGILVVVVVVIVIYRAICTRRIFQTQSGRFIQI